MNESIALDPSALGAWADLIFKIGLPVLGIVWAVINKRKSVAQALDDLIPVVWNVVQQELRKNDGKLPNGKSPLEYAVELIQQSPVKVSKKSLPLVEMKLKAYHEKMGAPSAKK